MSPKHRRLYWLLAFSPGAMILTGFGLWPILGFNVTAIIVGVAAVMAVRGLLDYWLFWRIFRGVTERVQQLDRQVNGDGPSGGVVVMFPPFDRERLGEHPEI